MIAGAMFFIWQPGTPAKQTGATMNGTEKQIKWAEQIIMDRDSATELVQSLTDEDWEQHDMDDRRDYIVTKITRKHSNNWMQGNVIALDEAHHACSPHRPNGWDVQSIQIDGGMVHVGKTCCEATG